MKENLRKVVIINEMHSQVAFGTGAGGSAQGQKAVIIGDNGRVLFTGDGGNTWEKLPRVTPEHLVSIQFNPFDDFYYEPDGNPTGSPQTNEFSGGMHLPFGNGIATGSVLYNWAKTGEEALTDCLPDGAAPNVDGSAAGRFTATPVQYRCTKPEVATILRTNCGGSLNLGQWRCSAECTGARRDAVVPVVLTDKRASDADWNAWFGTYPEGHQRAGEPYFDRFKGTSAQAKGVRSFVGACDEVWTLGHGRRWHEDTRETRHYQAVPRDEDGIDYMIPLSCDTAARKNEEKREGAWETCALRPAHDVCMYGWPRHLYRMHEGRLLHEDGTVETIPESDWATADQTGYTFLNRPRHDRDSCIAAGGTFYYGANRSLDCVIEFGEITECPSWQVYGMGHSRVADQATRIPFVNFSKISDPCQDEWYGVTCGDYEVLTGEMTAQQVYQTGFTPNQSVTQMWLYSNNLQGRLPTELYALFSLQSLSLGSNRLVGSIPPDLWKNKTHLRYLSLAGNSLTGAIPETLGGLPNVEELKLHHNLLTGEIPEELGQLGKLQSLGLHENSLGGALPSELGKLGSLQYLWLHNNQFNGSLPSEVGQLSELRFLWFANNSVVSLPRHIGRLQRLRSLDGSHNELSVRLPYTLGNMTALRVLKLHHNRMRATTPDSLGLCTELEVLELQNNELVGPVPASFGGLQKLTRLDMSNNLLERKLPVALDGMRKLQYLSLRNNLIEGGVPAAFGALSHLSILDLAGNALTEPLPDELVQCDELEHLDLEGNAITGALPAGIWRLHKLEYLVVDRNALDGPLPEGLGYLKQLRELRLSDNNIDGTLPYTLGDATTLEIVRLDQNKLSGTIPSTIGRLRNVLELNMQVNSLAGAIPSEIDGMTSALTIKLDRNQLTGQMPVSLGNLTKLEDLELSHNRLAGTIPPSFGTLFSLRNLSIDDNQISGSIPVEVGELRERIELLHFQQNRLNGLLPTFFKRAEFRLVDIRLQDNPFWCPLPKWQAIHSATCLHCPNDTITDDESRTCSDHGVCIDGHTCRCDPRWEGDKCDKLRCPGRCNLMGPPVGEVKGYCVQAREPEMCELNATDPTTGMCTSVQDTCVAAYHDCPHNGISLQVDSEGITIPQEEKHNQILYARCQCINKWSGADCSIDPPKPPTEEPWPDPYAAAAQSGAGRDAAPVAAALAAALAAAAFGRRRQ